ncbi:MAG: AlpA family transcriptional regulator [Betaproteobacteria bacterium]|nr:AlpA family transcriptional regulator [Betaproteobacteria bacterium]
MSQNIPALPATGFLRLSQVLQFIPFGKTRWYRGIKTGEFPKPVNIGSRARAYRAEDIRNLIKRLGAQASEQ